jgi:hypothetical protein
MDQVAAAPADARRRRTSVVVTAAIAIALVVVFIAFAADAQWYTVFKMFHVGAAVIWVGGGIFITICALLAELSKDDDQLLAIGHWAEVVAVRLFPIMSFVVLPRARGEAAERGRGGARPEVAAGSGAAAQDPARRARRRGAHVRDRARHDRQAVQLSMHN